jgi:predicted ATP-grasp superfamily ATP-dependent carboligase
MRKRGREHSLQLGAVVVGGDYQGLGIVRSLGRTGFPVCVVDDERSIARHSRYATYAVRVPNLKDEEAIVESLLDVGQRLGLRGWVLFATRDEVVTAFSRAREQLLTFFRVPTPAWESVRYAADKRLTYELANRLEIPFPRTWYPGSATELDEIEPQRWPILVKPAIKEHFIYKTRVKGWLVRDRQELQARFKDAAAIVPTGEVMVQDMIPGNGRTQFSYCTFFKGGRSLARMTVQRQRQQPADLGRSSTFVETVEQSELAEPSARFLQEIDYYGLAELEYKLDEADGQYKLLDVNARTWGYHSIGVVAGVDFPLLVHLDQFGLEVGEAEARPGVRWVRLITDLAAAAPELARRRLTLRDYVRSLRQIESEASFARDDRRPALAELFLLPHLIRTRTARRLRR